MCVCCRVSVCVSVRVSVCVNHLPPPPPLSILLPSEPRDALSRGSGAQHTRVLQFSPSLRFQKPRGSSRHPPPASSAPFPPSFSPSSSHATAEAQDKWRLVTDWVSSMNMACIGDADPFTAAIPATKVELTVSCRWVESRWTTGGGVSCALARRAPQRSRRAGGETRATLYAHFFLEILAFWDQFLSACENTLVFQLPDDGEGRCEGREIEPACLLLLLVAHRGQSCFVFTPLPLAELQEWKRSFSICHIFLKSSALCFQVRLREEFGFLRRFWCSFRDFLKPKEFKTNPWALNERKTPPVSHQSAAGFPHKIQFSWWRMCNKIKVLKYQFYFIKTDLSLIKKKSIQKMILVI